MDLKTIQLGIGVEKLIEPQENHVRAKFIEQRIDQLLVEENFFFFKIFKSSEKDYQLKNAIELEEIKRLVEVNFNSNKVYLKSGQIEPLYLTEEERKLLTEGMEQSIQKIKLEVYKANKHTQQITNTPSERLVARLKEIDALQARFGAYLTERPFVFQKYSSHGLVLAKEMLSKAREEVNQQCLEDLASEISKKQEQIDKFTRSNKPSTVKYILEQKKEAQRVE